MKRKLLKASLIEDRCSPGWPHALRFEFTEGWPETITLAENREYSAVQDIVDSINDAIIGAT